MDYTPAPFNTSHINIPNNLLELAEVLAKNVHENWAKKRVSDGWSFGEARDDEKLLHPGLVPYESLSESEKEYDRITAIETVKTILALDYTISKKLRP